MSAGVPIHLRLADALTWSTSSPDNLLVATISGKLAVGAGYLSTAKDYQVTITRVSAQSLQRIDVLHILPPINFPQSQFLEVTIYLRDADDSVTPALLHLDDDGTGYIQILNAANTETLQLASAAVVSW